MRYGRLLGFVMIMTVNLSIAIAILFSASENPLAGALLLTSFVVLSWLYAYIALSGRLRPVSFMLLLFWCYGMMMPALYQVRMNQFYWYPMSVDTDQILPAAVMCLLSTLAYVLGYITSRSTLRHSAPSHDKIDARGYDRLASFILLAISLFYSAYAISRIGITHLVSTREAASSSLGDIGAGTTQIGMLQTLPASTCIATFMIIAFQRYLYPDSSLSMRMMFYASAVLMLAMNFPLSIPRFMMISIAMVILLTVFNGFLKRRKVWLYVSAPIAMYLVFPFLGQVTRGSEVESNFFVNSLSESMLHGDFDGFQSIMNVHLMVEEEGLSWGGRLLSAILFMVPRSIWSGKHEHTGADAAEAAGYDFLNVSMPLPGELFSNFGWVGVVVGLFLFGRLISRMDLSVEGGIGGRYAVEIAMIGIILAAYMPILFRGALLGVIAPTATAIGVVVLWGFLRRLRISSSSQHVID